MSKTNVFGPTCLLAAAAVCCLALSACSVITGEQDEEARNEAAAQVCASVATSDPGPTTVILAPGMVPTLERVTVEIADANLTPVEVYQRFAETDAPDGGVLVVAHPTPTGDLSDVQAFDLRVEGANSTDAGTEAIARRDCLVATLESLPEADVPELGGAPNAEGAAAEADVVSSVPAAIARARDYAGTAAVDVAIFGLSRSNFGGQALARVDLRDGVRATVLDRLAEAGVRVPRLEDDHLSVRFVAPGEGLPTHLQSGLDALSGDLCAGFQVQNCRIVEEL